MPRPAPAAFLQRRRASPPPRHDVSLGRVLINP
jgi:hypothetical protein